MKPLYLLAVAGSIAAANAADFERPVRLKGGDSFVRVESPGWAAPCLADIDGDDDVIESICTRPFAVDWNGDGKLDLVVGTFSGSLYLFLGEGGGKFKPKPQRIMAGGSPLNVEHHGDPFIVDWDGDGDLDLL